MHRRLLANLLVTLSLFVGTIATRTIADDRRPAAMQLANDRAGWRVSYAPDAHILALDVQLKGKWERIDFLPDQPGAELTFRWKEPVEVAEVVYYGRTAWDVSECFRGCEIYLDDQTEPVVTGPLEAKHGPQPIRLPAPAKVRKLRIKFANEYTGREEIPDGANPGASEIQIFSVKAPKGATPAGVAYETLDNLALKAEISASCEFNDQYKARFVADGRIPEAGSRDDAGKAWCVKGDAQWQHEHAGPRWYGQWGNRLHSVPLRLDGSSTTKFIGRSDGLVFSLEYASIEDRLAIVAGIANRGTTGFQPVKAGLKLGLDTCMATWPEWNRKLFPTLLRCEKTHFWGYAMDPSGRILGIASPAPIASWSLDYRPLRHHVYTLNLDLLNAPPIPARHPQDSRELAPGQERRWTIFIEPIDELTGLKPKLARVCEAPMIEVDRYTVEPGQTAQIIVYSRQQVELRLIAPSGESRVLSPEGRTDDQYRFVCKCEGKEGVYTLTAATANGKQAEAKIYLRHSWSWYLQQARREAIRSAPRASTHTEGWYGLFSMFLARRHFPDKQLDLQAEEIFQSVFPLLYDRDKLVPLILPDRIQNTAAMCSLLTDRYRCTQNLKDLETAAALVEFLIQHQHADGGYYNGDVLYTSVVYIAKSIMEVMVEEKKLASSDPAWQRRYDRHYRSVQAAMDDLERRRDNIQTEGELTFEDGMISCSATQLAMFALLQQDGLLRRKYADAALSLMRAHRCLAQLAVPDCRMNGATLRFWEAQYDVLMRPNMINSPHGWSAWRIYGTWYLYQLTGDEEWLRQTFNALGSCIQLVDSDSGKLRWAFVSDPYIQADVFCEDPARSGKGMRSDRVIGEQYIDMISGWWKAPPGGATGGYWDQGGCCDNDVHEIFKCLEEVALTSAYVVERPNGQIVGWNCRVEPKNDQMKVTPSESVVSAVHVNLKTQKDIAVLFGGRSTVYPKVIGMRSLEQPPK